MKNLLRKKIPAAAAVMLVLGAVGCVGRTAAAGGGAETTTSTFDVEGMTCAGCEAGVKLQVKKLTGVTSVEVSYDDGTAVVTYDPETVTPDEIIAAIQELGYNAELPADAGATSRVDVETMEERVLQQAERLAELQSEPDLDETGIETHDSLKTLHSFEQFVATFDAYRDVPRIVLLLSPT